MNPPRTKTDLRRGEVAVRQPAATSRDEEAMLLDAEFAPPAEPFNGDATPDPDRARSDSPKATEQ